MSGIDVYEQFLSQCDNGFVVIDNDCSIVETNNAVLELTGYNDDELSGAGLYVLFDNFTAEKICTLCDTFGCKEIRQKISGDLLKKDGKTRHVEVLINCTGTEDENSHWLLIKNKSFRKEMEDKLRQSELMLQSTLESLPFDFWINDAENRTYMQNSHSKALWGDVKGRSPEDVTDDGGTSENWLKTTSRALAGEVINGEISYIINGRKKYFRNILAPIKDEEHMLGVLGMNIDITDLKEAVETRDMLLKEVHHRVKNNLQMISSIINLEAFELPNAEGREVFEDLVSRIDAVSLVHEKLYTSDSNNIIHTSDYIRDLVDHIMSGVKAGAVFVEYELEEIELGLDRIIILGLIINELVTNSAKYAFFGEDRHKLTIRLIKQNTEIHVEVSDNGPGLPEGCEDALDASLGFRMIEAFSQQLGGKIVHHDDTEGCRTKLIFPIKKTET